MTACIHPQHDDPVDAEVGLLCAPHYAQLRSQLLALPAVAGWLHVHLAAGGVPAERVSGSRDDPIPLRVELLDLIGPDSRLPAVSHAADQGGVEAIRATLEFFAQAVHDESGAPFPDVALVTFDGHPIAEHVDRAAAEEDCRLERWSRRRLDDPRRWRVTIAPARAGWPCRTQWPLLVDFLAGRLTWVAGQPWVVDLIAEVAAVHRHAHRLVPWRAETKRDTAPCSRCQRRAVVVHIAAGESRCERKAGGCGRRQPLSDYELNVLLPKSRRSA